MKHWIIAITLLAGCGQKEPEFTDVKVTIINQVNRCTKPGEWRTIVKLANGQKRMLAGRRGGVGDVIVIRVPTKEIKSTR